MSASEWGLLAAGDHVCVSIDASADRLDPMVDFADAGLHHGDKIMFFIDDPTPAALATALADRLPDGGAALRRGQIRIVGARESYLPGGVFRPAGMLDTVAAEIDTARREGYVGIRLAGDLTWADPDVIDLDQLADYESRLNPLFTDGYVLGICAYDPRRFAPDGWRHVASTHPVIVRSGGRLVVRLDCRRTPSGLRLTGEADPTNDAALPALLASAEALSECVIDAADLRFVDARGISALLRFAVARDGRPTTVVAAPHMVRLLHLLGAGSVPGLTVAEEAAGQ